MEVLLIILKLKLKKEMNKNISKTRIIFNEKYEGLNEKDLLKEILYSQKLNRNKLERIRSNASTLVWFLIVIPIIFLGLSFLFKF